MGKQRNVVEILSSTWSVTLALCGSFCLTSKAVIAHEEQDIGLVDFRISCSSGAQAAMNEGVTQLHNMMYLEAENIFSEAAQIDSECAMLHWGISMTRFHPLWPGRPSTDDMQIGTRAINQAKSIGGGSERENSYITAAANFYEGDETPWKVRLEKWSLGQKSLMNNYPDDVDAKALFALSHLSTADKADKTLKHQREAGTLLEKLHEEHPQHPAGFHYLIHAYDNPLLASKAAEVSEAYDKLAPEVPHALHMPTHIFTRMGMWPQSIRWNHRSADAALAQSTEQMTTSHYAHAIDYLVYAYLQIGDINAANEMLIQMWNIANHQDSFASAYALAAAPARIPLETEAWAEAAELNVNDNEAISWENFPAMTAITEFARGIGAARSNRTEVSAASIKALDNLRGKLLAQDQGYWATLVEAQQNAVEAWHLFANEKQDEALKTITLAANLEDSVEKHGVTPGAVLPARELMGDMLMLMNNYSAALDAYDQALVVSPNRARSLKGAEESAIASGNDDLAKSYKHQLDLLKDTEAAGH